MELLRFSTRRYADPSLILNFQAPGLGSREVRLTEEEAIAISTRGFHDRVGDYWLYLYAWEGEAYVLAQFHDENQGLVAPPIPLKSFEKVALEIVSDVDRVLTFYMGDSAPWRFPYRRKAPCVSANYFSSFLYEGEEAQDFGRFITALAQNRARMLDFIDFQDPEYDVVERLLAGHCL